MVVQVAQGAVALRLDPGRRLADARAMARGPLSLLPSQVTTILKEVGRHILRRPVVGVAVVGRRSDGQVLLIRRADTGTWAIPGGTLEWGETLRGTAERELLEEAGARILHLGPVTGVYSRPDRDPRFHAVTIIVTADVADDLGGPKNALEIREARFFARDALPRELAMQMDDMLAQALSGRAATLE